ncbi:hypothetical protein EJB05_46932, partial [Eragrostis curvula]
MAGGAPRKTVVPCLLLIAVVGLSIGQQTMAANQPKARQEETCLLESSEVPASGACICSRNCACAGKCLLDENDPKACFIDCVLKNGCACPALDNFDFVGVLRTKPPFLSVSQTILPNVNIMCHY